jgi:uncharacterized protein YraI
MTRMRLCSWIIGLAAALPATAMAAEAYTTTAVNLRAGPDADYPLVRWVPEGTEVEVYGCLANYQWCDVEVYGDRGWMSASYLVYPYQSSNVPIVTYGAVIGLPLVGFTFDSYWHDHYRGRSWYGHRERWAYRHRPEYHPPRYSSPHYSRPPQYRPPQRPPQYYPPAARPPEFRPPQVQRPPQYDMRPPPNRTDARPPQRNYQPPQVVRPPSARPPGPAAPPQVARPPAPQTEHRMPPGRSPQGLHNDAGERGGITTGNY